ncbi:MAG: hypothetical protein ABI781_13720, partial [Burkholderiales bacterium]
FYVSLRALYIRRLSLVVSHYDITFHNQARKRSSRLMVLVAIAWIYVVLMVAVVEATSPQGTLLGAFFTLLLYGVLPLGIVGYLFLSPARKRARRAAEAASVGAGGVDPDHGGHAAGDAVAPERKEP